MKNTDPFSESYNIHIESLGSDIKFTSKGECGMGGPTQGRLIIPGSGIFDQAMSCIMTSDNNNQLAFMTWFPDKGGAKIRVHILDIECKNIVTHIVDFGAYKFIKLSQDHVQLVDVFSGKLETIKF